MRRRLPTSHNRVSGDAFTVFASVLSKLHFRRTVKSQMFFNFLMEFDGWNTFSLQLSSLTPPPPMSKSVSADMSEVNDLLRK